MSSPKPSPMAPATPTLVNAAMDPPIRATIFVAIVTVHALLLMWLGSRRRCSRHPALRFVLWSLSAAYLPLMSYVLSYMTTNLWSLDPKDQLWLIVSLVLVQFLKAKADMKALAVAAVATPVAADDDINSLKVRPTMESLIYSFWVAGLVIYHIFFDNNAGKLEVVILFISPLWALGACRMVLKFVAFHRATGSFALGRNVQLMDGYMVQLQEAVPAATAVPRLIVTGERKRDIEESPLGYRLRRAALEDEPASSLVTLDRVWLEGGTLLVPQLKDLCLSFALFKCLRRRFAGYQLAETGSSWAFRFVRDGLLGREDDHERIFRVIASELTFASDFYYYPLPVASLGTLYAGLHFVLSMLIFSSLCLLVLSLVFLILLLGAFGGPSDERPAQYILPKLPALLALVIAWTEMSEMVASVRSNWTKISIVGHYIRCRSHWARRILSCLLGRCKSPKQWKDEMGQTDLLLLTKPRSLLGKQSWAHHFFKRLIDQMRSRRNTLTVPPEVKASILGAFRSSGGQLSAGTAAVHRRRQAFRHGITWACLGGEVTTATDSILVWCIATGLFENRCSSSSRKAPLPPEQVTATDMGVALCLSRYCMYLVAEAPDLLPDNSAWTRRRYQVVKDSIKAALLRSSGPDDLEVDVYGRLVDSFGSERSHEVLKKGSRLGKQLVEEAEKQRSEDGEAGDGGQDTVWKLLAEFWSEMLLYLSPSDNVKGHMQVLQHGGELITLMWVLLLHAGITSRPARHVPEP
ncbi:hypothetical protein PAHAL_8G079500 [Panicum hallii]|uniref:DUF4220 domain-containing protein n=1 Tax=Panicum hallii TaxID=206008 RepID=A0A2T8I856_9POAL|nr:uncharacterized protein LOC112902058 isoform X1 [Panicum hallii]PVH33855.1 hypothetical protein PAHAL_8G079500 [Panicum hallii]